MYVAPGSGQVGDYLLLYFVVPLCGAGLRVNLFDCSTVVFTYMCFYSILLAVVFYFVLGFFALSHC